MSTADFPFIEIPQQLTAVFGKRDEGTRIYRTEGPEEDAGYWFEAIDEVVGKAVSPGGVSMFCPVSRAAVHKRIKEGRLSAFLFHATEIKTNWFGKKRVLRQSPYILIPLSEAKAWKEELEQRALKLGHVSQDELEGNVPDWHGDFLEWKNRKED